MFGGGNAEGNALPVNLRDFFGGCGVAAAFGEERRRDTFGAIAAPIAHWGHTTDTEQSGVGACTAENICLIVYCVVLSG